MYSFRRCGSFFQSTCSNSGASRCATSTAASWALAPWPTSRLTMITVGWESGESGTKSKTGTALAVRNDGLGGKEGGLTTGGRSRRMEKRSQTAGLYARHHGRADTLRGFTFSVRVPNTGDRGVRPHAGRREWRSASAGQGRTGLVTVAAVAMAPRDGGKPWHGRMGRSRTACVHGPPRTASQARRRACGRRV